MLVSLTVGKVDAGVTVLLTPDKRLIEFPSILLPPNITSGSIVDITVARNHESESAADKRFAALQDRIFSSFGASEPANPVLRCRNATQTSVVLEWDPVDLATADLISLSLYRNGQKAGNIPRPLHMHSTKISGLAVDTQYSFHLVLRTTAGTFSSKPVNVSTHKMTDLSGITITTGLLPPTQRDALSRAVERVGAKLIDQVRIDTTHFVTTEGRGLAWEKAVEMNIPVVRPEWVDACERNGRILGVTKFYLDAVRPGPADDDLNSTRPGSSSTNAPTTPAAEQASKEKDLPAAPTNGGADDKGENGNQATKPNGEGTNGTGDDDSAEAKTDAPGGKDQNDTEAGEDSKEEDAGDESKSKAATDEQKVRVEDKEGQKVALRPAAALEDPDTDKEDSKPAASPADGGSFENVAL